MGDAATAALRPRAREERVEFLDVLRGFALLGIVLVNAPLFFQPIHLDLCGIEWWPGRLDRAVSGAVIILAQAKFYTLFSLLFGLGLVLQARRIEARGGAAGAFLARRLGWLLAIGLLHALGVWFGDILVAYALAGLMLLPLRRLPDRRLLAVAVLLLASPVLMLAGIVGAVELARFDPGGASTVEKLIAENVAEHSGAAARAREVYPHGTFREIAAARAREFAAVWVAWPFWLPSILGLFAVGFVAGRRHLVSDPDPALLRRALGPLAAVGLLGSAAMLWGVRAGSGGVPSFAMLVAQVGRTVGGPALALAYVALGALAFRHEAWRRRLLALAPAGRMALTNYIAQSVVFTLIANAYGLGLYGRVPPAVAVPAGLLLWGLQIPASRWWLARFRFGPLEWAWRSLTYRERQPFRRPGAP